ncbi:alpha/beta fold hydrolase [Leucothrix sargassi]|nr:alpha/beta fold hydrolase [Leucothrix sargassi]
MDASIWNPLATALENKVPFQALNLPGYGGSDALDSMSLDSVVDWLAEQFEGKCHLLAWSMGGLVAQGFALKYPERLVSLSLVGATPCFTQRPNWPYAMAVKTLAKFKASLIEDQNTTLRRFIALQFMGESAAAKIQRNLRQSVLKQDTSQAVLALGLDWLSDIDFTIFQPTIRVPQHWMFGELDQLVPVAVGKALQANNSAIEISYFDSTGHVPHLTQLDHFAEKLLSFLSKHTSN